VTPIPSSASRRTEAGDLEVGRVHPISDLQIARSGESVACAAQRAFEPARSCIAADEAIAQQAKLRI
jgi:hypothetical protein